MDVCARAVACTGQEEAPDPLGLALQEPMSCLLWVLGSEFISSGRAQEFLITKPCFQPSVLIFVF